MFIVDYGTGMSDTSTEHLLGAIEALYQAALSPGEYEEFAVEWDRYLAGVEPDSDDAEKLLRHIDQAMSILDRLHPASRESFRDTDLVSREAGPAAVIDATGYILNANEHWRAEMNGETLWEAVDDSYEQEALRQEIRSLHEISEPRSGFARITEADTGNSVGVSIRRLREDNGGNQSPTYLVRTSHAVWSDRVGEVLGDEFKLTPAELALLKQMALGNSFSKIAEMSGRSLDTLKSQSKAIYRKMNVTGREDVVRVSLQLHLLLHGEAPKRQITSTKPDQGYVQLSDGRRIAWTLRGAVNGQRFIFLHGMGLGHAMTEAFIRTLRKKNLTAICLDRPGYGRSDPPSNWRRTVEEWKEMFPAILQHFELETVAIVSHTSGVLYGCAAASAHPERVLGVCALAGGAPINDPSVLSEYPNQIRILSRTARLSPKALRFVLSSSAAFYRSEKGRQRLIERTYGGIPCDSRALKNQEIRQLVHDGMGLVDSGGYDGFVGDGLRIFGDWTDEIRQMQCELHYVLGDEDPICPVTRAQSLAQRFEHVRVTSLQGAGQLLHHTHPDLVMSAVVQSFAQRS